MLPLKTDIKEAYRNGRDDEQNFIQNMSLFLCTFLRQHGQLIDRKPELHDTLLDVCLPLTRICFALLLVSVPNCHFQPKYENRISVSGVLDKIYV